MTESTSSSRSRAAQQVIDAAAAHGVDGSVWRTHWREAAAADWSLSLQSTGRYHRGLDRFPESKVWPVLYTSLAPEIAVWEMVRRSAARNLAYLRNNVLSELDVDLARVLDLTTPSAVGLAPSDLMSPDLRLCHELAEIAHARGFEAILVPSAALPGSNLVIFPRNLREPFPIRLVRSTELPLDLISGEQ